MQKVLSICFLLFLNTQLVLSQNSFVATVLDHETGEPITGATVSIQELNVGAFSNAAGQVKILNIPDGIYQIKISFVGYESIIIVRNFPLEPEYQDQIFELHHAHEELEQITITSTRSSRTIEDIPTRVEFIAGEELAEKGNMKLSSGSSPGALVIRLTRPAIAPPPYKVEEEPFITSTCFRSSGAICIKLNPPENPEYKGKPSLSS